MNSSIASLRSSAALRVIAVAMLGASLGACSSDVARFSDNPFSNPFASRNSSVVDRTATGSIGRSTVDAAQSQATRIAPAAPVSSRSLAAPAAASAVPNLTPRTPSAASSAMTTGSLGGARAAAATAGAGALGAGAVPALPTRTFNGWSSAGGTPIVPARATA